MKNVHNQHYTDPRRHIKCHVWYEEQSKTQKYLVYDDKAANSHF